MWDGTTLLTTLFSRSVNVVSTFSVGITTELFNPVLVT